MNAASIVRAALVINTPANIWLRGPDPAAQRACEALGEAAAKGADLTELVQAVRDAYDAGARGVQS